jgi:hypothetical protein
MDKSKTAELNIYNSSIKLQGLVCNKLLKVHETMGLQIADKATLHGDQFICQLNYAQFIVFFSSKTICRCGISQLTENADNECKNEAKAQIVTC